MDIGTIIIGLSAIVGIIAGIVQVIDFLQKKIKHKKLKPDKLPTDTIDDETLIQDGLKKKEVLSQSVEILHNLPPRNEFVGRKDEIEKIHFALLSRPHTVVIDGIGGVGKTSLALEIAHECLSASKNNSNKDIATFMGFIWISTKGHDLLLDNMLDEIAQTLNQIVILKQPLKEKRKSILRILQNSPSLIIVDSYETITDPTIQDFLIEIPEPSKVLITTRIQKSSQAKSISLRGLPETDAIDLIKSHGNNLGISEIEKSNEEKLLRLCKSTDGHPLAIKWALGQIKQKGQSLSTTLDYLEKARGNIFDQVFLNSWNLLSQDSQRILRIMPIFATDANKQSIEVASQLFGDSFNTAINQLVEMSLVNFSESGNNLFQRYSIHPLTKAFALTQLEETDTKTAFYARKNLAIFYEEYTREHGGLWNLDGFELIKIDISNIINIIKWCIQEKLFDLSTSLIDNIRYFLINYGYWNTALEIATDAVRLFPFIDKKPSRRLKEWQTKIVLLKLWPIAWIHRFRGNFEIAKSEIISALELFKFDKDDYNVAYAQRHLSLVLQQTGEVEEAEKLLLEAREFSYTIQDESEMKYRTQLLTSDLSVLALKKGDLDSAWNLSSIVFDISSKILDDTEKHNYQNLQTIAIFYRVLGSVSRQRGDFEQAKMLCEKALSYTEKLDYRDGIADASFELAQVEVEMGQKNSARQKFERAYSIYKALGMDQRTKEIEKALSKLLESNNAAE